MKSNETILASATRTRACPSLGYGSKAKIKITAKAYHLAPNAHPHFSVQAEIYIPGRRDCEACGCLHREALKFWPAIAPIIDLHGSNADDGAPSHAEGNGWYWMAGALGGAGEQYHGANSQCQHWKDNGEFDGYRFSTPDESLKTCAEHLRISMEQAQMLRDSLKQSTNSKAFFGAFVEHQRPRWKQEAEQGLSLIRSLSCETETVAA